MWEQWIRISLYLVPRLRMCVSYPTWCRQHTSKRESTRMFDVCRDSHTHGALLGLDSAVKTRYQTRQQQHTRHGNSNLSTTPLPTDSTIHKLVSSLSRILNYLAATTLQSPNTTIIIPREGAGGLYSSHRSFERSSRKVTWDSISLPRLLIHKLCVFLPSQSNIPAADSSQDFLHYTPFPGKALF